MKSIVEHILESKNLSKTDFEKFLTDEQSRLDFCMEVGNILYKAIKTYPNKQSKPKSVSGYTDFSDKETPGQVIVFGGYKPHKLQPVDGLTVKFYKDGVKFYSRPMGKPARLSNLVSSLDPNKVFDAFLEVFDEDDLTTI